MRQHIQVLAILHIIYGAFNLVVGACATLFMFFGWFAVAIDGDSGGVILLPIIALTVGAVMLLSSLPGIIGGIGILAYQNWARILLIIVAVLSIFSFPFGTALAVYTFWVLLNNETQPLFS